MIRGFQRIGLEVERVFIFLSSRHNAAVLLRRYHKYDAVIVRR